MITYINVLRVALLYGIRPNEDRTLVISAYRNCGIDIPNSFSRDCIHTACRLQLDKAIYSALVDDKATVFCARDCHEKMQLANLKKYLVVDLHLMGSLAQSESIKAISPASEEPSNTIV